MFGIRKQAFKAHKKGFCEFPSSKLKGKIATVVEIFRVRMGHFSCAIPTIISNILSYTHRFPSAGAKTKSSEESIILHEGIIKCLYLFGLSSPIDQI